MALAAGGIGSGLDVNGIVGQLMSLEAQPLRALQSRERELNNDLSSFGRLKSELSLFQSAMKDLSSASKFEIYSAKSSDEAAFTAVADQNASGASYAINVVSLAANHTLASSVLADTDTTTVGTGTLTIGVGGNTFDVAVDGTNNTLAGLKSAINSHSGNTGVTASIVSDDTGHRLVLKSDESGASNNITVSAADDDLNNTDAGGISQFIYGGGTNNMAETKAASDSQVNIDGIDIYNSTNVVTGAIEGVTLTLKQEGATGTLAVERDTSAVKDNIKKFVDAYNSLRGTMNRLGGDGGDLQGDTTLINIERQLADVVNTQASGLNYGYLSDLGITSNAGDKALSIDDSKLDAALAADFSGVSSFFSDSTEGFAVRMESVAKELTRTDGLLDVRQDGLQTRIDYIQDRQDDMEYRLEITEARYRRQFSALDSLIAQFNASGSFLSQQLGNLPGMTR